MANKTLSYAHPWISGPSRAGKAVAHPIRTDLIAVNMRMKPDRVLLAELRGDEAFDLLKLFTITFK
jgi:type IV secretory pathway ATPase VirB11/archaellum biosynthesis ATPase